MGIGVLLSTNCMCLRGIDLSRVTRRRLRTLLWNRDSDRAAVYVREIVYAAEYVCSYCNTIKQLQAPKYFFIEVVSWMRVLMPNSSKCKISDLGEAVFLGCTSVHFDLRSTNARTYVGGRCCSQRDVKLVACSILDDICVPPLLADSR